MWFAFRNPIQPRSGETVNHFFRSGCCIVLCSLHLLTSQTAHAQQQPFTPASDDEVLLVLPKSFLATRNELSDLRDQLNAKPDDPELAVADVASKYLALGNRSGDPRFYGYARAAINRWWETDATPQILEIRAKLKEKDHLYDDALKDLKSAKALASKAQVGSNFKSDVLLRIGNIYRVQGRYDDGMKIGDQIQTNSGDIAAALSRAPIMAQTGQAQKSLTTC